MKSSVAYSGQFPPLRRRRGDLWDIVVGIGDRQPGNQRRISRQVALLVAAIIAALIASGIVGWVGWFGFVHRQSPPLDIEGMFLVGVLYLVAIALAALSGLNSGKVIEPQFLRIWPVRGAAKILCVFMGVNALMLVASCLILAQRTPVWISTAALLLSVGARISWWAARGDTPPLLGFLGKRSIERLVALTVHWCINAAVLFGLLGFVSSRANSPQLFTAGAALAITLAIVARAVADNTAIRTSVARLEQALAKVYVTSERLSRVAAVEEVLPALQEALLELHAAMANSEGSKLPHRIPNADPLHLMMVTYLCRRLGGMNLRLDTRLDVRISHELMKLGVTGRQKLAVQAADYVLALAEQLTGGFVRTADFTKYRGEDWNEELEEHFPIREPARPLGNGVR